MADFRGKNENKRPLFFSSKEFERRRAFGQKDKENFEKNRFYDFANIEKIERKIVREKHGF